MVSNLKKSEHGTTDEALHSAVFKPYLYLLLHIEYPLILDIKTACFRQTASGRALDGPLRSMRRDDQVFRGKKGAIDQYADPLIKRQATAIASRGFLLPRL